MKSKLYIIFLLSSFQLPAQLYIDNSYSIEEMVMDFFDNSCVSPSNITTTGTETSLAFFDAGGTDLGVQAGIFISTGDVFSAIGPNIDGSFGLQLGIDGDADLDNLLGSLTYDGIAIEMDIIATETDLSFSYVFASEEYPEFVGSEFNDVFAFFISGSGINGLENIALIPGTTQAVAINNVNANTNASYYIDNTGGQEISFDGYTTEMNAQIQVVPNETYHVKIVIADALDAVFDSGIFLGIESLCGDGLLEPTNVNSLLVDGNTITFDNQTKYVKSHFWDFGDSTTSNERIPAPHTYSTDGTYEVMLITSTFCCSDTSFTPVQIGELTTVDEIQEKYMSISPNPIHDLAWLTFKNEGTAFTLRVFDTQGKLVLQEWASGNTSFDFSTLSNGIYFLEVQFETNIYRERMIKN